MTRKTVCLNMIVKNEAHIIESTLKHLALYIKFDHWVICDTGSTDDTIAIIQRFFAEKNIPGSIHETPWKDFAFNRTDAFNKAFNLTDYVFVWDADDSIEGNFKFPENLTADCYKFTFGNSTGFRYSRCQLFNNKKKWKYVGVLHEYPVNVDPVGPAEDYVGDYYFVSGRSGSRNKDPNKYINDALILEKAYYEAIDTNDPIHIRYAFYCAQSYNSCNEREKAIEWYKKTLTLNNWAQEKYICCMEIYDLYEALNRPVEGLYYLVESYKYDNERVECFYRLIKYYCINGLPQISNMYYNGIKDYFENFYQHDKQTEKLFVKNNEAIFYLPYYMIIVGDKIKQHKICAKMYEIIFHHKFTNIPQWWINNLFFNIQFCISELPLTAIFINNMFSYIEKLKKNNIHLDNTHTRIITKIVDRFRPVFSRENVIDIPKNKEKITTMLTITTCKRLDLFNQTVNSLLNNWQDLNQVDYFLVVDDNSSEEDRKKMKDLYPFFNFYMKTPEEKGHRESMNIIWNKLNELKPTYWIQMEDDWLYFQRGNYVAPAIKLLNKYEDMKINQIVFNRNYGLMYSDLERVGGINLGDELILHEKKEGLVGKNCGYWPHYSLQPSICKVSVILELGNYDSPNKFFERDYADKYFAHGYQTAFFPSIYSLHIGKQHWEKDGKNAYALNETAQFNNTNNISNNMEGYSNVFNKSINLYKNVTNKQELFSSFRKTTDIFGFIDNGDTPPDAEAVAKALSFDSKLYETYATNLRQRKIVGYGNQIPKFGMYSNLDSRHIMLSIFLFNNLPKVPETIVEIGGGFGNWFYLNKIHNFNKWTIIDLPHLLELQQWYLEELGVDKSRLNSMSAYDYQINEPIDLVLGVHSLSEFSINIFNDYFNKVITKAKYFYYCYHNFMPHIDLITTKLKMIESQFTLLDSFKNQNGDVTNCLYINKNSSGTKLIITEDIEEKLEAYVKELESPNMTLTGSMMDHLLQIIEKIKTKTPFGLIRPSDGEHTILLNESLTNCDNWTFNKDGILNQHLKEAVSTVNPNLYIGIPCNTCNKPWNCTDKIYNNFINTFKVPIKQRTYANIFGNSNWKTFIDFIKSYTEKFSLITSGDKDFAETFIIDKYLVNDWDEKWEGETERLFKFIENKNNELILFSAGPLSKVWIPMCMKKNPNNMYVDVGGAIDILSKGTTTRLYTNEKHPFSKEFCVFKD